MDSDGNKLIVYEVISRKDVPALSTDTANLSESLCLKLVLPNPTEPLTLSVATVLLVGTINCLLNILFPKLPILSLSPFQTSTEPVNL